jgi:hypothetical protein
MVTLDYIKELVESKVGGIDIGTELRTDSLSFYRFIAFKLCRMPAPNKTVLTSIGKVFNRSHGSVIHGLKRFDEFKHQSFFEEYLDLYNKCVKDIEQEVDLKVKLSYLKYRPIFKEISELSDSDLDDFEVLANDFLQKKTTK